MIAYKLVCDRCYRVGDGAYRPWECAVKWAPREGWVIPDPSKYDAICPACASTPGDPLPGTQAHNQQGDSDAG